MNVNSLEEQQFLNFLKNSLISYKIKKKNEIDELNKIFTKRRVIKPNVKGA